MKKTITVDGMCCDSCTLHVKNALEKLDRGIKAKVKMKKGEVVVKSKNEIDDELIKKAIEDVDYKVVAIK